MAARVKSIWKFSITTSAEAEEAVIELIGRVFGTAASVYASETKKERVVSTFLERLEPGQRAEIRDGLRLLGECGLDPAPGTVKCRKVRAEDWAESWKRHFKPLEVSPRLLVKPSWSKRKPKKGQALVVLDPGLSFGTGQHPTTGFCLQQLARLRDDTTRQSLLDAGCGSGILAIAATKLGYAPVEAFDFDPDAVRVANENAGINNVTPRITRRDLTRLPVETKRRFDVVCANLIYDLLISHRDTLLNRLAPNGVIVLAGILRKQFAAVRSAFESAGMKLVARSSVGEWTSGAFTRSR